ncbi:MAG: hypothetical protein KDD44_01180 [Bdellovibrionales bacterium]|nr:hypothetical protein [Bdellovibrionales bacterium]
MSILTRIGLKAIIVPALVMGLGGCGASSTNNQGTSVLGLGYFDDGTGEAGDAGTVVFLEETIPGGQGVFPLFVPVDKDPETSGIQGGYVGVENRLTEQFIRTIRHDCDYIVPGSDPALDIPSDSWNFTAVIPPATVDEDTGQITGSTTYTQVQIVSNQVVQFLNVNRNLLPELPFRLTAICNVVAVSQAGDTFVTNDMLYQVIFTNEPSCRGVAASVGCSSATGAGPFVTGVGTGGNLVTFGDPDPETTTSGDTTTSSSSSSGAAAS